METTQDISMNTDISAGAMMISKALIKEMEEAGGSWYWTEGNIDDIELGWGEDELVMGPLPWVGDRVLEFINQPNVRVQWYNPYGWKDKGPIEDNSSIYYSDVNNLPSGACFEAVGKGDWQNERLLANGINPDNLLVGHDYLAYGDYDNSSAVERSNVRVFLESFPSGEAGVVELHGDYGSHSVMVQLSRMTGGMVEMLEGLEDYPVIDESDMSEVERELEDEAWENWARDEFKTALTKLIMGTVEGMIEDVTKDHFRSGHTHLLGERKWVKYTRVNAAGDGYETGEGWETDEEYLRRVGIERECKVEGYCDDWSDGDLASLFWRMADAANEYWYCESGGNMYIRIDRVIKEGLGAITPDVRFLIPREAYVKAGVWGRVRDAMGLARVCNRKHYNKFGIEGYADGTITVGKRKRG